VLGNNAQALVVVGRRRECADQGWQAAALACFSPKRTESHPDVPTLKELGYDVEFSIWVGLFAPKGTPDPVVARLRAETKTCGCE
jgi:tripartite-type tricarboxylate transporter receptor subunit TctC